MKAPGADYSPISQAISSRTNAVRAGYAARNSQNWEDQYKLQQKSIQMSEVFNGLNVGLNIASAGVTFADKLHTLRTNKDTTDATLTQANVQGAMQDLIDQNRDQVSYEMGEDGLMRPVYSDALKSALDKVMEDGYKDKKWVKSVADQTDARKQSIWNAINSRANEVALQRELETYEQLKSEKRSLAMEADIAIGKAVTKEINGNSYTVGENYLAALESEGLDDREMELALIQGQKTYKTGSVDSKWRKALSEPGGSYGNAREVIFAARVAGDISQDDADTMMANLKTAHNNMDYDPDQTKLNFAIEAYKSNPDYNTLLATLDKQYTNNHAANVELARQALNIAAGDVAISVQSAQQNIALAIEQGDEEALASAILSVPGARAELQQYADSLEAIMDNATRNAAKKSLEEYKKTHTWTETMNHLDDLGLNADDYQSMKQFLITWESSSESLSIEQQNKYALQVEQDSETAASLRDKALSGSEQDKQAYFSFLESRDAKAYGGEAKLRADTYAQKTQFNYDNATAHSDSTLRSQGYEKALDEINSDGSLTKDQKTAAVENLKSQEQTFQAEIQADATRQVGIFSAALGRGEIAAGDMAPQVSATYETAKIASERYPAEYRDGYMGTIEASISSAYTNGMNIAYSLASNSKDEQGNYNSYDAMVELHEVLKGQGQNLPDFLKPSCDQVKSSVAQSISSMKNTYGEESTQMHINNIRMIGELVKDGKLGAKEAIDQIYSEYNVVRSGGAYTFGSGDTATTYGSGFINSTQLEQINKVAMSIVKELTPDFDSDPILKNQYDLLSQSIFGCVVKDLSEDQLPYYYSAQQRYLENVFDACVKWQNKETSDYTIETFVQALENGRENFTSAWLKVKSNDPDSNNGEKKAAETITTAFENGLAQVSSSAKPNKYGWYNATNISVEGITTDDLKKNEARIYSTLKAEGYDVINGNNAAYRPNEDGSMSLVYMLRGQGYVEYNTKTRKATVLGADNTTAAKGLDTYLAMTNSGTMIQRAYRNGDITLHELLEAYQQKKAMPTATKKVVFNILEAARLITEEDKQDNEYYWSAY